MSTRYLILALLTLWLSSHVASAFMVAPFDIVKYDDSWRMNK
jgi:hypothetical protein